MQTILNYTIVEVLSISERSLVYRCLEPESQEPVILKVLNKEFPTNQELNNFREEYNKYKMLENVVGVQTVKKLLDYQNSLAIVFQDTNSQLLSNWIEQGKGNLKSALQIAINITQVLDAIHELGFVHKNINPGNLLWQPQEKAIYLADFALATRHLKELTGFQNLNALKGSLPYISPEQTGRLNHSLDHRSDLYSLGVVLYQLLVGRLPFTSEDANQLVHAHVAIPPKPLNKVNPGIPDVVSTLVLKLLEKLPENRYQTAKGVQYDLQHCLTQLEASGNISDFAVGCEDISLDFAVSQKLYGREHQREKIMAGFETGQQR